MEPNAAMAIATAIIGSTVGIAFIVGGFMTSQPLMGMLGIVPIGIAFYLMQHGLWKAEHFQLQKHRYETARRSLLQQLDQAMKAQTATP